MSGVVPGGKARELTDEEIQQRATTCYEIDQRIRSGLRTGREAAWQVAQACYEFDGERGWSALGYDTLGDWLGDPEVGMSRTHFYRMVRTYDELVVRRQVGTEDLQELEPSKVEVILPAVKAGTVKLQDALADAKSLGRRDLQARYYHRPDPGAKTPDDGADHDGAAATSSTGGTATEPVDDGPFSPVPDEDLGQNPGAPASGQDEDEVIEDDRGIESWTGVLNAVAELRKATTLSMGQDPYLLRTSREFLAAWDAQVVADA